MFPAALSVRIESLIDELIHDGGIEAVSMASILLAAKDSVERDDLVTLSQRVWSANEELSSDYERQRADRRSVETPSNPSDSSP